MPRESTPVPPMSPMIDAHPAVGRLRAAHAGWAVAVGLLATSCGGGSEGSAPVTTGLEREIVEVVLDDYRFSPATLTPGAADAVRAKNLGGLAHSWSVLEEPIETESELDSATVLVEARVEVGQSSIVEIGELAPGRYQVVCVIPGHVSAGMVGELVVGD